MIKPKHKEFTKISQELGFKASKFIRIDDVNGLFIVAGEINNKKVTLKIIPLSFGPRIEWVKKDVLVTKLLSNKKKSSFKIMNILREGETAKSYWFVREYIDGISLSKFKEEGFLTGYDLINQKYLTKQIIKKIILILKTFQLIEIKDEKLTEYHRFPISIDKEANHVGHQLGIKLSAIRLIYKDHFAKYFSESKKVTTMGDFSPSNIIVKNESFYLFDFEHFGRDNYSIDIAYLWLFLWRYKEWQNILIKEMIKTDENKKFFLVSLARIILFIYNFKLTNIRQSTAHKEISALKNFVWTRYLIAAGESFEAVMKVK